MAEPPATRPGAVHVGAWIEAHLGDIQAGRAAPMVDDTLRVVVVAGRGPRSDWHTNDVAELFLQVTGDIAVLVGDPGMPGSSEEVVVREGELWLAPARVPHAPQRPTGSIGLVIEAAREAGAVESFAWHCQGCGSVLRELTGHRVDPGDLRAARESLRADPAARTCAGCGTLAPEPT